MPASSLSVNLMSGKTENEWRMAARSEELLFLKIKKGASKYTVENGRYSTVLYRYEGVRTQYNTEYSIIYYSSGTSPDTVLVRVRTVPPRVPPYDTYRYCGGASTVRIPVGRYCTVLEVVR